MKVTTQSAGKILVCLWLLLGLVACGSDQHTDSHTSNENSSAPPVEASNPTPPVEASSPPPPVEPNTEQQSQIIKPQIQRVVISNSFDEDSIDQDGDGLIDALDNDPITALQRVSGEGALSLAFIGTDIDGSLQKNNILANGNVSGRVDNSGRYSPPFYLLWHHAKGVQAQEVSLDEYGHFTVIPEEVEPTGVSITAQGVESDAIIVTTYPAQSPLIFTHESPLIMGNSITLRGINTDAISELWLGNEPLDFTATTNTLVTTLPSTAHSNTLIWKSETGVFKQHLMLVREIELAATSHIAELGDWSALSDRSKIILPTQDSTVLSTAIIRLPLSNKPRYLRFYHENNRSVEAVIWPQTRRLVLGTQSTLESHIVRRISAQLKTEQQANVQALIEYTLTTQAGAEALNNLSVLHTKPISLETEQLLKTQVDNMLIALAEQSQIDQLDIFATSKQRPIQRNSSLFDYFDDTFASVFASNVMYQPISKVVNLRSRHGANDYSGMSIGMYRDLSTCVGLESLNQPAGIWPSDLCARNEGVYFASLKVSNALTNKVLKNHVKEYLDTSMIGASGWGIISLDQIAYITSDKGAPLCHMQACRLEFLTGGLGLGTSVSMTNAQKQAQNIVLGRTMLERVVLPVVGYLLGKANVDGDTGKCLAKHILTKAPTSLVSYGTMIAEFKKKVDSANNEDEVLNTLKETVAKYAYDVAASMLASNDLPTCLSASLTNDYLASLKDKVSDFAEKAALPFLIAEVATTAFQGFQAVSTPEKFIFEVAPRASITRVSTSNSTDNIPELFSTVDSNRLLIRGTKFVYLKPDNSHYWPKLRLADRYGNKQTLQLGEQHKIDISDFSWVDIGIPVSDLKPLMKNLRGDIINVSIIMDDIAYPEFSSEGLPLPGADIRWVGQPKLFKATPQNARAGRLMTLRGENLQSFGSRADLKLTLIQANDENNTGEIFKVESATDTKIQFRLPSSLPINLYKLRLETSDPDVYIDIPNDISKGNLVGAVNVIPQTASLLELYDAGAKIDDAFIVYVANANGDLISQNNEFLSLELLEDNILPAVTMWWQNEGLSAQNNGSTVPGQVSISCDLGGSDQICTYRVKGEINVNGTFKAINFRGKLKNGDSATHSF